MIDIKTTDPTPEIEYANVSRKIWIEYLRLVGVLGVITIHATARYFNDFRNIGLYDWMFANILNAFSRFSVPIFVMISGCVLLGRNYGIRDFYIKRGIRIIPPFIFWSLFYIGFDYYFNDKPLILILSNFICSGKAAGHLWYLPLVICLMLFTPFINNYTIGKRPSLEDYIYMLVIFSLFMLLNQIVTVGYAVFNLKIDWSIKSFHWYIGYFIMGYFISVYYDKIPIGNITTIIILGVLLIFGSAMNFYSASTLGIIKDWFVLDNAGILNFMVSLCIFYLFSKNRDLFKDSHLISSMASMSFGIYLIHLAFLSLFSHYMPLNTLDRIIYIPFPLLSG